MAWKVNTRYVPNRKGIQACSQGPELTAATRDIAEAAMDYAVAISPQDSREYVRSFFIDKYTEREVGKPYPWPRVGHILGNTAEHAIIVEVGAGNTPQYAVLRRTLEHLDRIFADD